MKKHSTYTPRGYCILAVVLTTLLASGCGDKQPEQEVARPIPVLVSVAKSLPNAQRQRFSGTVVARNQTQLSFQVSGKVATRYVDEGDTVTKGQVLARLDGSDYELATAAAKEQVAAAEVQAKQAARDAARLKALVADGTVSRTEYENLTAQSQVAKAQTQTVRQQLKLNQNKLKYLNLKAPASGVLTRFSLEPGQVVGEGMPVGMLASQNALELAVDLPDAIASNINNWRARLVVDDKADPKSLTLRTLAPMANPIGQNFTARFVLPAGSAGLKLGMSLPVEMVQLVAGGTGEQTHANAYRLPSSSVLKTADAPFVWVVEGSKLKRQPVSILRFEENDVWLAGLGDGQQVVSVGGQKLSSDMTVRAVPRVQM